jgi:iron complex outermembrane receptor protein
MGMRKELLALSTALVLLAAPAAADISRQTQTAQAAVAFDIPAQPLGSALIAFGQQAGTQVVADSTLAAGIQSVAVNGQMSADAALGQLLAGTGLGYQLTNEGTYTLYRLPVQEGLLAPVQVKATRTTQTVSETPSSVVVIDEVEIAEQLKMNRNPADLIRKKVPGFAVPNVTISGASENLRGRDILILVDGMKRDTPLRDVARVLSLIDLNTVERIEVVSSPSAIFGAGATGGTINFITKKATAGYPQVTLATSLTAFTADIDDSLTPETSLSVTGDADFFDYAVTATGNWSQDSFDGAGNLMPSDPEIGQGGRDNADDYTLNAKIGRDFAGQRLEAQAEVIWYTQKPDFFTNYSADGAVVDTDADYTGKPVTERSNYVNLRYTNDDIGIGDLAVTVFHNDVEKRFAFAPLSVANSIVYSCGPGGVTQCDTAQASLYVEQAGLTTTVNSPLDFALDGMTLSWGFDYTYDETSQSLEDGREIIAPMDQHSAAAFAQIKAPVFDWLTLSGGARYEYYDLGLDDFRRPDAAALVSGAVFAFPGANITGADYTYDALLFNAGAVFHLNDEIDLFGGFSQGFSTPDIGAFTRRSGIGGLPSNWSVFKPRAAKVDNYEVGLRGDWESVSLQVSGFYNESDWGTTYDPTANTLSQQPEQIWGAEVSAQWDMTDALQIGGTFGYQEGKQDRDNDGDYEAYLPNNRLSSPFRATAFVDYLTDFDLGLRAESLYFSGRDRFDGTTRFELEDAITFNFLASYPLLGGDLSFAVENVLDETYENPTSSATRSIPVNGYGRTVGLRFAKTF